MGCSGANTNGENHKKRGRAIRTTVNEGTQLAGKPVALR